MLVLSLCQGFSGGSVVKNLPSVQETWVWSLYSEDPPDKGMEPNPVFLPGTPHRQMSLAGYSPWDCKRVRHDLVTKQQQKPLSV